MGDKEIYLLKKENVIQISGKKLLKAGFKPDRVIEHVLAREAKTGLEINLIFTDNAYIKRINLEYRMKNYATDVISFESANGGDILISVEKAKEQAKEYGISPGEELTRLLVHGAMHVLGYDHIKAADRVKMEAKEKKYMRELLEKK